ncbi:thymidylate kinase [Candidatus Woesearchaeota archaeon]|nr:thymidylate kinase [Candidatus Woesearchaeota archaeon]
MVFIVIDGTDGAGKATQTDLLESRLKKEGYHVMKADFPRYGEPSAWFVERYLNGDFGPIEENDAYRASEFYAVDRFAASFGMRAFLAQGGVLLSNRYVSANKGHQLGKIKDLAEREKFLTWLDNLEYGIFGVPKEDKNILLYLPPELGQLNVDKKTARDYTDKKRDLHEDDADHLRDAAAAYLFVAERENWDIVHCAPEGSMLPREDIHEQIYGIIRPLLPPV